MLVPEEMRRTVRYFKHYRRDWELKSEKYEDDGLEAAASYARKYVIVFAHTLTAC